MTASELEQARHAFCEPDAKRAALFASKGLSGCCDICGKPKSHPVHKEVRNG